jgi:hypothetical protein
MLTPWQRTAVTCSCICIETGVLATLTQTGVLATLTQTGVLATLTQTRT